MTTKEIASMLGQTEKWVRELLERSGYIYDLDSDISQSAILHSFLGAITDCHQVYGELVHTLKEIIAGKDVIIKYHEYIELLNKTKESTKTNKEENKTSQSTGFVYIAKQKNESNVYKIGKTENITQREKTFKNGNAYIEIIASTKSNNPYKLEKILHAQFCDKRLTGEWFELSGEDLELIISVYGFEKQL